jgi:hypothetical protein
VRIDGSHSYDLHAAYVEDGGRVYQAAFDGSLDNSVTDKIGYVGSVYCIKRLPNVCPDPTVEITFHFKFQLALSKGFT